MIRILPFEAWREIKLRTPIGDDKTVEKTVRCGRCGGSGEIEDEGVITGQAFDAECPTCDGFGEIEESEQVSPADADYWTTEEYESEVKMDLSMLAEWTHKPYWLILFEAGFEVSFSIDKQLLCARLERLESK